MTIVCGKNPPDAVLHLGDCVRDCAASVFGAPLFSLRGNNDFLSGTPLELTLDWEGVRLFACHGHAYGVKGGLDRLTQAARERKAQVALFGHTHHPCLRYEQGILLCNPGSIGCPYGQPPSYGELLLTDGKAEFRIVEL